MLQKTLFFILFHLIQCQDLNNDGIIRIPLNNLTEQNIQTKYGIINYQYYITQEEGKTYPYLINEYLIKNIKNLNLYNQKTTYIYILGKNKDIAKLSFDVDIAGELDEQNIILCELFYQTKYIDKKILSIGKNEHNEFFKFYGGTPLNLINNLNKYTFNINNNSISEVEFYFEWKKRNNRYNIRLNSTNNKILFKDDSHLICLSHDIFSGFQNLLFHKYTKCEYRYDPDYNKYQLFDLSDINTNFFPEIKFKIGNKTITFNKNNLIYQDRKTIVRGVNNIKEKRHNYLFIKNTPCDKNIFGLKFLEEFNIREYNIDTKELNLYLSKDKNLVREENDKSLQENSITNIFFIILLLLILITIIMLNFNYSKNKNNIYFNDYIEI